jgi:hypothetical protein
VGGQYVNTNLVSNTDEEAANVEEMRQFAERYEIKRLVIPDELPPVWGERAGTYRP